MTLVTNTADPFVSSLPGKALTARHQEVQYLDRLTSGFIAVIILSWGIGAVGGFQIGLTILTAFGFLTAIMGVKKPLVGFLGIGMLCTLDNLSRSLLLTGGILRWNTLNYWLLFVMLLNLGLILRSGTLQSKLVFLFVVVLTFFLLLTPAEGLETGIMTVLNIVIYFGLLVYFSRIEKHERIWYLQGLIAGTLAGLGSLAYYIQKSQLPYINPNAWAYFPLTAIFALCLGYRFAPRGWKGQIPIWILATVNYAWVFLSGSRGGMLVGSACILFLLLTTRSFSQRIAYALMAVVLGLIALSEFSDLSETAVHRVTKLFNPDVNVEGRTSGRSDLAKGAWYIFKENPFGVGTGGFSTAWANLGYRESLSGFGYEKRMEAHSGWAKVLAENGIIGMPVFICFVLSFAAVGWLHRAKGALPLGLLVTVVLGLAFFSTDFAGKGLWYLSAGATVLLNVRRPRKRTQPAGIPPEVSASPADEAVGVLDRNSRNSGSG
jgi:hypothetical protein